MGARPLRLEGSLSPKNILHLAKAVARGNRQIKLLTCLTKNVHHNKRQ